VSERVDSCFVVGGGVVAARAVTSLLEAGTRVTVVSPWLAPALLEVAREAGSPGGRGSTRAATCRASHGWSPRPTTRGSTRGSSRKPERGLPVAPATAPPIPADHR
jgi:siroheme synthase (precorrin-2 oxidase/ferrochelatase)